MDIRYDLFLPPFFLAFAFSVTLCLFILSLPFLRQHLWRAGARHQGKNTLPRLGGIAMGIALILTILADEHLVVTREIAGLMVACVIACAIGLWDDFRELSFKAQAFLQVALAVILFVFGMRVSAVGYPFGTTIFFSQHTWASLLLGFGLLLVWIILVMNAVNWLDGLDGLLGGVSFITFLTIFFLSLKPEVNQPPVAILAIIALGVTAGFLFFNLHPAKILAGTSGSMLLGLLITVLAVIAGTKIATALLVLALPVIDALFVIGERLRFGQSIFQPDERHLHYKLRELGWSEHRIAWFFFLLTALVGLIALHTQAMGKLIAFALVMGTFLVFLIFVAHKTRKKYHVLS